MDEQKQINTIQQRASWPLLILILLAIAVILSFFKIYKNRDKWLKLSDNIRKENVLRKISPIRGNIYADNGELLSATMQEYRLLMDFNVEPLRKNNGKLFWENVDSLSYLLAAELKDKSQKEYKKHLIKGYNSRAGYFSISDKKISPVEFKKIKKIPIFREKKNKGGFIPETIKRRIKPYSSLAAITIGNVSSEGKAINGIEHAFNNELKGTPGSGRILKKSGVNILVADTPAINGKDIITTLNVNMQDICEKALRKQLVQLQAESGCVLLMEVKTGQIKSCVNLKRKDSTYHEVENIAFRSDMEPGSTFKIIALMAALEDGTISPLDTIDCGNGIWDVNSKITISDHNTGDRANGVISVEQVIVRSSNVGIGKLIYNQYDNKKKAIHFIEKIKSMGVAQPIDIGFTGMSHAFVKGPNERHNWTSTDIASISMGYSVNMPLLYTLTFYNAIANNGKMMQPYLVSQIKTGNEIQQISPKIMKEKICSEKTLNVIKNMMLQVVEDEHGTARIAQSQHVRFAGKTGTARYNYGNENERFKHQVSFCGFFPYENPQYTCIVYIRNPQVGGASGGGMAGRVFKDIAERVMASMDYLPIELFKQDSLRTQMPQFTKGYYKECVTLFDELNINYVPNKSIQMWANISQNEQEKYIFSPIDSEKNKMPDLTKLGLKDAIYYCEKLGKKTRTFGQGKVYKHEPNAGEPIEKNSVILLYLK